ncbi:MAG: GGDEF domain-containing protein [Mariprofundus sp.]|nr:GGDEF domain-containing protein [Mariprofundus sp.]
MSTQTQQLCRDNDANTADVQSYFDLEKPESIQEHSLAIDALQRFRDDENMMAIPVVNALMQPVGLITRRTTLSIFGYKFSYALNSRKTVKILMGQDPLSFDTHADVDMISRAMTDRHGLSAFDPALMTQDGVYCGLLSVITLLKRMTDIRIEQAFDCNPLSRLPGNNSINREMDLRLQQHKAFMLIYVDLDNFKAFNDHYGYERGDRVIQLLTTILKDVIAPHDFLGHVGGDDFVMLLEPVDWRQKVEMALSRFSQESMLMYHADDQQRGFIVAENRQGQSMHFALMSLSMAVVPCEPGLYESHITVAEVVSEVKHLAKKEIGNSIVINRRTANTGSSDSSNNSIPA